MSENLNRDFSQYEAMSTEELEEILRLDAEAPEGAQSDTELLLFILEVLASRRNTKNITGNTAQKAWKSFQQNYMPEEPRKSAEMKKNTFWMRRLVAAAAVAVLLIFIPISTSALTLEAVWDIFARWAKETFSFVSGENAEIEEPNSDDNDEFLSFTQLLDKNNISVAVVPTWIPDGFLLEKIEKDVSPIQETYFARYSNGTQVFFIRIQNYLDDDFQKVETNQEYSEIYPALGVEYYLFENIDQCRASWVVETYECIISGDLSIEEIKLMIDSIGKG